LFGIGRLKRLMPARALRAWTDLSTSIRFSNVARGPGCKIPSDASISGPVTLGKFVDLGHRVVINSSSVGDYSYVGSGCSLTQSDVGKFCSIAPDVYIGLGIHPLSPFTSTHPAFYLRRPDRGWLFADRDYRAEYGTSKVGNDVWIGLRAAVKDSVVVGDGAVVAAGAVVVSDVPPYAIVGGVPAKLIRYRFSPEVIDFLLDLKWWDRNDEWFHENWVKFHDVQKLVAESGNGLRRVLRA